MGRCRKPFSNVYGSHGCGQCLSCRIDKRRGLVNRILCESYFHDEITFATLTVDSDRCKTVKGAQNMDIALDKPYVQKWLNRFRMRVAPTRIRYFLVGEYGSSTHRPHYHAILFGYPHCPYGGSRPIYHRSAGSQCPCPTCALVSKTWRVGNITLDPFNIDTANYIAGYVVDKINEEEGFESWRLSSDGLGLQIVSHILDNQLVQNVGSSFNSLSHGGKTYPMSKYLKGKIHNALLSKLPEELQKTEEAHRLSKIIIEKMQMRSQEFHEIRKEALKNDKLTVFEQCKYILDKNSQPYKNLVARNKQFRKKAI